MYLTGFNTRVTMTTRFISRSSHRSQLKEVLTAMAKVGACVSRTDSMTLTAIFGVLGQAGCYAPSVIAKRQSFT
jgi:hypothetical protein